MKAYLFIAFFDDSVVLAQKLPISDIDPAVEFASDLAKMAGLNKSVAFVHTHTGIVRQCYRCDQRVGATVEKSRKELIVKLPSDSLSLAFGMDINGDLDCVAITGSRPKWPPVGITVDRALVIREKKGIALVYGIPDPTLHLSGIDGLEFKGGV